MEDREIENFKTLQKKKDRSMYAAGGNATRGNLIANGDERVSGGANGVPPNIRARYRNSRKTEAKNDTEHGKRKQGILLSIKYEF